MTDCKARRGWGPWSGSRTVRCTFQNQSRAIIRPSIRGFNTGSYGSFLWWSAGRPGARFRRRSWGWQDRGTV
eukprot:scaffold65061_cov31-Tisochrysis_lutea.AAC.1